MEKVQDIVACNSLTHVFSKKWMKVQQMIGVFKNIVSCHLKVLD